MPPVDEAWHKIKDPHSGDVVLDVARIARDPRNMSPILRDILEEIGNPGRGWVSRYCYEPKIILEKHLQPLVSRLSNRLVVLHESVVKRLETNKRRIVAIEVIMRSPQKPHVGYDRLPSQDLNDWYDPRPSDRFDKRTIRIAGNESTIFIDATEWGEILALSGRNYLQGVESKEGSTDGSDLCGQSTVFGFAQRLNAKPTHDTATDASADGIGLGKYEGKEDAWAKIWTYRRLLGNGVGPTTGDVTLQNWGYEPAKKNGGNDYPFGYLLLSREATRETIPDWRGGVNLEVMAAAESRAFAWHRWMKNNAPPNIASDRITLAADVFGTDHGLCKLPYIRDTRRSIGLNDFVLTIDDLMGKKGESTGTVFPDRIAIGAYPADVHFLVTCKYPEHVKEHQDTKPFYIPFRALTHRDFDNLLVAGKTMAQSFMANSATRLHPIEWSSGTAAGVVAAYMNREQATAREVFQSMDTVQELVKQRTPIDWFIQRQ